MADESFPASRSRGVVLFAVLAALWDGVCPIVTLGLESFLPALYAAPRLDIGATLPLPYAARHAGYWRPRTRRDQAVTAVAGVLSLARYSVLRNIGQQNVLSAVAPVLAGSAPILTIGFARLQFPDERFGPVELFDAAVSSLEFVVVTDPEPTNPLGANATGQAILVLVATALALGGMLIQRIETGLPFAAQIAWVTVVGTAAARLTSAAGLTESLAQVDVSLADIAGLVYPSVFTSAVNYLLYFSFLSRLDSVELDLVTYAIVGSGTVYSWLLLTEPVIPTTLLGFGLILLSFGLLKWR